MGDDDQNEKPATAQFDDEQDPEHDEEATNEHGGETSGEDDEPTTAKFDEVSDDQHDDSETNTEGGTPDESGRKHVVTEDEFERELDLDRETTADFLEDLANQLRAGTSLTVSGDDWEIPFEYAEPIEVEVEYERDEDEERELEIEIEFEWGGDGDDLEVQ